MDDQRPSMFSLVLLPAILTLVVTVLRLVGQMQEWNPTVFGRPEAGGGGAMLGIGWLIFVFGFYFGVRMQRSGHGTSSPGRALILVVVGVGLGIGGFMVLQNLGYIDFPTDKDNPGEPKGMELMFALIGVATLFAFVAWPRMALTMLVYAVLARIPVIVVTWLALENGWESTHYTKLPKEFTPPPDDERFVNLAMAQATFWPAVTVVGGTLMASLAGLLVRNKRS